MADDAAAHGNNRGMCAPDAEGTRSPARSVRRRRVPPVPVRVPGRAAVTVALVALLATTVSCGSPADAPDRAGSARPVAVGSATGATPGTPPDAAGKGTGVPVPPAADAIDPGAVAGVDATMRDRVFGAGLSGGDVLLVHRGTVVLDRGYGDVDRFTPMSVASAAKWWTSATLMTFVDEGVVGLDDPVERWLPAFAAIRPAVTVRHLLSHTSGLAAAPCLTDPGVRLADCIDTVASLAPHFAAGSAFAYGNVGFHVAGRLIEVLGGAGYETVVRARLAAPLGLTTPTWRGSPDNPNPADGLNVSVDDYGRFLAMILDEGSFAGRRVLSAAAVREMEHDQTRGLATRGDDAVRITGIPTYGLGLWLDRVDAGGQAIVFSGSGGGGFYPWVDRSVGAFGVVGVADGRGPDTAVPASQAAARVCRAAVGGT